MNFIGAHPALSVLVIAALALVVFVVIVSTRKPSNDGDWRDHLALLSHADISASQFSVTNVKDWTFGPEAASDKSTTGFAANFGDLRRVWFVVEPSAESDWIAHTLLLFEFTDDRLLAATIEARLNKGEKWTAFSGLFNRFPLLYQWATARDVLTGRAVFLKHRVHIYPLELKDEQMRSLLRNMLATTAELETRPRFYNTLFSNCTNELAKRAHLAWHPTFVFTGRAANELFRRGVIPGASFAAAQARADFTDRIKAMNALPPASFDAALLAALRDPGVN